MSFDINDNAMPTEQAVERLRTLEDPLLEPHVREFAHYLADRIGEGELVPAGLLMVSTLAIVDLQRGQDGFTDQPIESDIVGLDKRAYGEMMASLPNLAQIAFSGTFADALRKQMDEMKIPYFAEAPEETDGTSLNKGEFITEPVRDIQTAKRVIVDDAKEKFLALDWKHFGLKEEEVTKYFDIIYPMVLRNAGYQLPLVPLVDEPGKERGLLIELMPDEKEALPAPGFWLAMIENPISPELAMLCRDHILLKALEPMSIFAKKDPMELLQYFFDQDDGTLERAAIRVNEFIESHPEALRS